jgi:hypothetical protein
LRVQDHDRWQAAFAVMMKHASMGLSSISTWSMLSSKSYSSSEENTQVRGLFELIATRIAYR